jgi:biotin operon repressor
MVLSDEHAEFSAYAIASVEHGESEIFLSMCDQLCCLILEKRDGEEWDTLHTFKRNEKGFFEVDMKLIRDLLKENFEYEDEDQLNFDLEMFEEELRFHIMPKPIKIKPLALSGEELEEVKAKINQDPALKPILELLCETKTLTASKISKKLKMCKRTVISKMKTLKSLGLVESRERYKGYRPTEDAYKVLE